MFFRLVTSVEQKKILIPHEESNFRSSDSSWGLSIFSLSQTSDKTKKTSFSISLPSSKLTMSLISIY